MRRVVPIGSHWPALMMAAGTVAFAIPAALAQTLPPVAAPPDPVPIEATPLPSDTTPQVPAGTPEDGPLDQVPLRGGQSDAGPFYDLDWSLGLRGAYEANSSSGGSLEGIVSPAVSLTRNGESDQSSISADAQIAVDTAGQAHIDTLHANGASQLKLDEFTTLKGDTDLLLLQLKSDDASLPSGTKAAPLEFTGTAEGSAERDLGQFQFTGRLKGERFIEGPSTLNSGVVTANTDQSYWAGEGGLRVGYALTPLLTAFVDGSEDVQKFDAPNPSLSKFLDNRTATLRGGLAYKQDSTLTSELSVGRAWVDYIEPSVKDRSAWVVDGNVTLTPDETLTLSGDLTTSVGPSSTTAGDTDVGYAVDGTARYEINPWLALRSSAGSYYTATLGTGGVDWGYSAGVGADFASSRHVVWSADYLFTRDNPVTGPHVDDHTVTVGVTIKR